MEFTDVVMKRRAVRRFEEGGVDREVIERIARLAQRTPSAGFSQGQRLVVVTDAARRREVARICGEEMYEDEFGPWISECAAQFIPCVSEEAYHRRYREPDKLQDDGTEIEWPVDGRALVWVGSNDPVTLYVNNRLAYHEAEDWHERRAIKDRNCVPIALKRGKTRGQRIAAWLAALLVFGYMAAVAVAHDPFPFLQ